jgi:glutamate carboxypeptidase
LSVIPGLSSWSILTDEKEDYTVPRSHESFATKPHSVEGKMKKKSLPRKPSRTSAPTEPKEYLRHFEGLKDDIVETTQRLVEIESPSDVKQAVDRVGTVIAGRFDAIGGKVTIHPAEKSGNHLQVDFRASSQNKPLLLLGHMDTVYPIGTLSKMPSRIADGRVYGPGVLDMKSGIALMLHAIEALRSWNRNRLPNPVRVLLVSDEEVGSESSRKITESLARDSSAVLVLEPAHGLNGAVKTSRKGVGEYKIKIAGTAAHAGLDFEKGQSAIIELAIQIIAISGMVDLKRGITLNVGTVRGGTRANVIPADAVASVDVRVPRMKDAQGIDRKLRGLKSFNRKCKIEVTGGINRPPMERTGGVAVLYDVAFELAQQLGWKLEEASVGGGSDGNFTAALGIPTLDGLGGVGEGAHASQESILISELPRRAALLTRLMETVSA